MKQRHGQTPRSRETPRSATSLLERRQLGRTGIEVSRLCFGTLVMGPLQRNLTAEEGGALLAEAYRRGVNFIDTAELYETYAHIRASIRQSGMIPVIATKSYAFSAEGARYSVHKALEEMELDRLDIFLLHEQESEHTLRGHREALDALLEMKQEGLLRAVGISTHHIAAVRAATVLPEIDVIHPLLNRSGLGICDGTAEEMQQAVQDAHLAGKGIYGMKVFGGGNLLHQWSECLAFALGMEFLDSIAIGMQQVQELESNLEAFCAHTAGRPIPVGTEAICPRPKALHVDFWCEGCGLCVDRCAQRALSLREGKAVPDPDRCVLCGYCASVCPVFALKVF